MSELPLAGARRALALLVPLALLAAPAAADTVQVAQSGFTFAPQDLTIQLGDTVRWVHSMGIHPVTEGTDGTVNGNEAFHGPLDTANPVFEVTFDAAFLAANPRPGDVYDYFCAPHFAFGMTGSVTVQTEPGVAYCEGTAAACPCGNGGAAGRGCANGFAAQGALLSGSGQASVSGAGNPLFLVGAGLVPNQPGLYFQGDNQVAGGAGVPFGDGLRCAGGGVVRLQVLAADAGGVSSTSVDLAAAGGVSAGQTTRYQIWYRDPQTSPCGNGFNLSNGYEVVWQP